MGSEPIESGHIYFFYRPKVRESRVRDLEDVQRFYMIMAPDESDLHRLLIIGQKYMPEILPGRPSAVERNWAIVDYIARSARDLKEAKLSWEETAAERTVISATPVGVAQYRLIRHKNHTELACALEAPAHPGSAQKTFNILPEASYILKLKNPESLTPGYPGAKQKASYSKRLVKLLDEDWLDVEDPELLNYENAQVLLIGARKTNLESSLGISFAKRSAREAVDDLYGRMALEKEDFPKGPLLTGEWPEEERAA